MVERECMKTPAVYCTSKARHEKSNFLGTVHIILYDLLGEYSETTQKSCW